MVPGCMMLAVMVVASTAVMKIPILFLTDALVIGRLARPHWEQLPDSMTKAEICRGQVEISDWCVAVLEESLAYFVPVRTSIRLGAGHQGSFGCLHTCIGPEIGTWVVV